MGFRILVVEDEPDMRVILEDNLEFEGYTVVSTESAEEALSAYRAAAPDLILLDVMLPSMSGYEMCRRLRARRSDVPIIIVTARHAEADRISGLEFGADDYVSKPFSVPELMARIRAQLRRRNLRVGQVGRFTFGNVTVDFDHRQVFRGSKLLDLSSREFELLAYLIAHQGQTISREQLLTDVWGYPELPMTRTIDNFVAKLRQKLEPDPHKPRHISTVHGTGYRLLC